MALVAVIAVGALAFIIAAAVIGREAAKLGSTPKMPVYRLEEAVEFVSEELPFEYAAVLSPDDVRLMLRWHINGLQFDRPVAGAGTPGGGDAESAPADPVVVAEESLVAGIHRRAVETGISVGVDAVEAVLEIHLEYLRLIGAVDRAA